MSIQSTNISGRLPKVSVIMNCLNCEKYLREAIDSVYSQTLGDWEIIFVDNASTDKSAEIAKSHDEKLRYFKGNETVPLGKARNFAIQQARGEYITFLDCDDLWLPEKLEKQVQVLDNQHEIDFVYGNYFIIIMPNNHRFLGLKGKQPDGNVFERFLYHYPVNMQTAMLRKTILDSLDIIFDETLNLSEEYDLFMRILYKSKADYLNEPLVVYRIHPNMCSIRFMNRYPEEIVYIIEKFKLKDPLFEITYNKPLRYLYAKIGYWRAKAEMAHGNPPKAREYLGPYKLVGSIFLLLYILTYFPPSMWRIFHDLKDKGMFR